MFTLLYIYMAPHRRLLVVARLSKATHLPPPPNPPWFRPFWFVVPEGFPKAQRVYFIFDKFTARRSPRKKHRNRIMLPLAVVRFGAVDVVVKLICSTHFPIVPISGVV